MAPSAFVVSRQWIVNTISTANFDAEVLQSQSAVCLVFAVDDGKCRHHMTVLDETCERLNSSTLTSRRGASQNHLAHMEPDGRWLKLCQIDGDANRNLASAFSVERSKLPVTFFIFLGTVVDRVSGPLSAERTENILTKFQEYYGENCGVDFSRKGPEHFLHAPLKASLTDGATTKYRLNNLLGSLLGADRIKLPEEIGKVDGLRKSIQEAKKAAFDELYRVHQKNGLDVRKASEVELERLLYGTDEFQVAAGISGLEALLLARLYAMGGAASTVSRQAVIAGKVAVERDFLKRQLKDDHVRQCVALCDVCVAVGDAKRQLAALPTPSDSDLEAVKTAAETNDKALQLSTNPAAASYHFFQNILQWIEKIDHRLTGSPGFPSAEADAMLAILKKLQVSARRNKEDGEKFNMVKSLLLATIQLHSRDPAAVAMRSRLSSILV